MTSGIPDYANTPTVLPRVVEDPTAPWSPEDIIDLALEEQPLAEPGTPGYSTTNYLILGEVLDELNGEPSSTARLGASEPTTRACSPMVSRPAEGSKRRPAAARRSVASAAGEEGAGSIPS